MSSYINCDLCEKKLVPQCSTKAKTDKEYITCYDCVKNIPNKKCYICNRSIEKQYMTQFKGEYTIFNCGISSCGQKMIESLGYVKGPTTNFEGMNITKYNKN